MRYLQVNNKLLWSANHLFSQKLRKKSRTVVLTDSDDEKHKTSVGTYVLLISSLALFFPLFPIFSSPSLPLSSFSLSLSFPPSPFFPLSISSLFLYFLYLPFSVFSTSLLFSSLFSPPLSPASSVPLVHAQQLEHQEQLRKQLQESRSYDYHMTGWNLC